MTSGSSVYDEISSKISELESKVNTLNRNIYDSENDIDQLTNERERCYIKLAEVYLPDLDAQSVKQTLKEVQRDVEKIFQQKQERRKELDNLMQQSAESKKEYEARLKV